MARRRERKTGKASAAMVYLDAECGEWDAAGLWLLNKPLAPLAAALVLPEIPDASMRLNDPSCSPLAAQ